MKLYRLSFHGPEDTKDVLLKGPELTISIQDLLEAFLEPAAQRCYEKFNVHQIEVLPQDIFEEAVDMLKERGFSHANEYVAVVAGTQVGVGDFGSSLGDSMSLLTTYNEKCRKLLESHEQLAELVG